MLNIISKTNINKQGENSNTNTVQAIARSLLDQDRCGIICNAVIKKGYVQYVEQLIDRVE